MDKKKSLKESIAKLEESIIQGKLDNEKKKPFERKTNIRGLEASLKKLKKMLDRIP